MEPGGASSDQGSPPQNPVESMVLRPHTTGIRNEVTAAPLSTTDEVVEQAVTPHVGRFRLR